jgi:hypothetical protein
MTQVRLLTRFETRHAATARTAPWYKVGMQDLRANWSMQALPA